jgi:carboxypeptidase C (cathepsin A)
MLNLPKVQQALGVDTNYTQSNNEIYYAFQNTGDFVYPNFIEDIEQLLNNSVRVTMVYGDADYICNWFGGEAVSKQVQYAHSAGFAKAGYVPFTVVCHSYPLPLRLAVLTESRMEPNSARQKNTAISLSRASTSPATKCRTTSPRPRSALSSVPSI